MPDYRRANTKGGSYFFTLTLADRQSNALTQHVDALREAYQNVGKNHPFTTIAICILPDHLHAIWQMPPDDADFALRWRLIKGQFSRSLPVNPQRSASKIAKSEKGIWQRRYWEHQIRDERDLQQHVDYIHYNPVKHGLVDNVADWPHSSFHRFVKRGDLPVDWAAANMALKAGE